MSKTEVTWDAYDVFAFKLDMTEEQRAKGVDAASRPSNPYGAPDRGMGHQGYPAVSLTYKGHWKRVLPVAIRQNREKVPPAYRSGVGARRPRRCRDPPPRYRPKNWRP